MTVIDSREPVAAEQILLRVGASVRIIGPEGSHGELKGNAAVMLAWVALEGHADRRRLAACLWPDSDAAQARSNLRVLVCRLNQRVGRDLLVGAEHLELDAAQTQCLPQDVDGVLAALEAGGAARCELLADAGLDENMGEALQSWLDAARKRQKRAQLARLVDALQEARAHGHTDRAVALANACVQLEPLSEQWHRQLMEVLAHSGDRAAALAAYESCKGVLMEELGVLPALQTRTVQLRILQDQAQLPEASAPAQRPTPAETEAVTRLGGASRYPLVERSVPLGQARMALLQGQHLVVQGEAGVGKTRLLRHLLSSEGSGDVSQGGVESVVVRAALQHEPYAALAQLLHEVQVRRAPELGAPERIELARLAPVAFGSIKPSDTPLSVPRLHRALRQWWVSLGRAGVSLLVVDDLHYADAASQAALASLLESVPEPGDRPPSLLLAHRSGELGPLLEAALTQAQAHHRAQRIDLPRLTRAGLLDLLKAMSLPAHPTEVESLAEQLHRRTGGNPLFAIELAQQTLQAQPGRAATDTGSLQALLASSLKSCSQSAQQLAAVAAVAADEFTVELAVAVTGHSPLSLMPAWTELQQRGLFAGHGLAHDLVKEAVLAGLPEAFLHLLHRQTGQYLELQGRQGAAVLHHYTAAGEADAGLPHAVHQLHAAATAGLPTQPAEFTLLDLLMRVSPPVLVARLWLTAELNLGWNSSTQRQGWLRLRAVRERVEALPEASAAAGWITYETARDLWQLQASPKAAFELLLPLAARLPERGLTRAYVEFELGVLRANLSGTPGAHAGLARSALQGLPESPSVSRLRTEIDSLNGCFVDQTGEIRRQANRRRHGRARGDLATVADASVRLGYLEAILGRAPQGLRHCLRAAQLREADGPNLGRFPTPYAIGKLALNAGHYALAQHMLASDEDPATQPQRQVVQALLMLRLGRVEEARVAIDLISPTEMAEQFSSLTQYVIARAEIARLAGEDPLPALRQQLDRSLAIGLTGVNLDLIHWRMALCSEPLARRLSLAGSLRVALREQGSRGAILARALLEIAEVLAEAQDPRWLDAVNETAHLQRRGCANLELYQPEGLLRCARLLRRHHPQRADELVQVAQRWVGDALRRLPPGAEDTFVGRVAVNRLLLGADFEAIYTQALPGISAAG